MIAKFKTFHALFLLSLLTLASCTPTKYVDISDYVRFSAFIGKNISTKIETEALGVTFGSIRDQKIDYVYIVPEPNFSGPEVLSRTNVAAGSMFKITGVYGSNSIFFTNRFYFKVVTDDRPNSSESFYLIEFNDSELGNNAGLDSRVFHFE
ncbi:hypothetical protein [Rheinheimera pleomorphica]|uniref:hypothetical protein n=1 Tax=Rheinheimera pleomorphica TaxID=2703963 RepID=UPI00141FB933|nr:hypothetical protein [Rheinheimera pleomorphica]